MGPELPAETLSDADVKSERRARLEARLDEIAREEAARFDDARDDALRDLATEAPMFDENDEEIVFDTKRDPQDVEWPPAGETVGRHPHFGAIEEPYDAMDAEDVGTEWLTRATEAAPLEGRDPVDLLDGTNIEDAVIEVEVDFDDETEFGVDQAGEPLARYAGTADEDIAARLPVGTVDANGNVELHSPVLPRDAFGAPPTSELSSTDEELARRAASETARRDRR